MGTLSTQAEARTSRPRNSWERVTLRFDGLGNGAGDATDYSLVLTNTDGFNTVIQTRSGITTVALTATASNVNGTTSLAVTRANTVTANNTTTQSPSLPHGIMSEGSRLRWSRFALDGGSGSVTITPDNNAASQVLTRSELAGSIARPANDSGYHHRTWTIHLTDGHNTRVITSAVSLPPLSGSARAWNPGTNFNGHHGTRSICVEQNGTLHSHTWVTGGWVNGSSVGNGGCNNYLGDGQSFGGHVQVSDGLNSRDFGASAGTNAMPRPEPIPQPSCVVGNNNPWEGSGQNVTFSTNASGPGSSISRTTSNCGPAGSATANVRSRDSWCYSDGINTYCNEVQTNSCSGSCRPIPAPPATRCPLLSDMHAGMTPPSLAAGAGERIVDIERTPVVVTHQGGGVWAPSSTTLSWTCTYGFTQRFRIETLAVTNAQGIIIEPASFRWTNFWPSTTVTDSGSCQFNRGTGSWQCQMHSMSWGA